MLKSQFASISLQGWRQFRSLNINVHPRLTIITGSNGAGKSTILNIFTQHFGFFRPYLATPKKTAAGSYLYDMGIYKRLGIEWPEEDNEEADEISIKEKSSEILFFSEPSGEFEEFGRVSYSNGVEAFIGAYNQSTQTYGLEIRNQQPVSGVHIGSHRALTNYQPVGNISLQPMRAAQAYNIFNQEIMTRYNGGHTQHSPIYRMKEALIGMAAFGEGNSYLQADSEVLETFKGFISILKDVLPEEIGFKSISIRIPDVVLETKSGDFLLDSSSGGINAIIEISWQIYLFSKFIKEQGESNFVVTMDEPENHLHPSMQRAIMPNLLKAFPTAQFIVATHSPFVVSAVEDSYVYVLNYSGKYPADTSSEEFIERRGVSSVKLDMIHKGGTAGEILREVLGVPVTTPEWVQVKIENIMSEFLGQDITNDLLNSLRNRLSEEGFGELYPEALSKLVESSGQ
jgi:AAA ATPase domain/AAA domain